MWLFKKKELLNDEALLADYKRSGDKEVFAELFKKHVSSVYGTCLYYLQDKEEAQDATMMLFEKLMQEIKQQEIKNFKAWLGFVVRNHCISIIRKKQTLQKNKKAYHEFEFSECEPETEEKIGSVSDDAMLEYMKQCLPNLKEKQRICIELFYLNNKSYQEISNETPYTINEIKSYIQNGKRNLKLLIEDLINKHKSTSNI